MADNSSISTTVVVGVAALLGQTGSVALLSGVPLPIEKMVALVFDGDDRRRQQEISELCSSIVGQLESQLPGDIGAQIAVQIEATRLLDLFGPDEKSFVHNHQLNANSVVAELMNQTSFTGLDMIEMGPSLQRILTDFYRILPMKHVIFADLMPHTQAFLINHVTRIDGKTEKILELLQSRDDQQQLAEAFGEKINEALDRQRTIDAQQAEIDRITREQEDQATIQDALNRQLPIIQKIHNDMSNLLTKMNNSDNPSYHAQMISNVQKEKLSLQVSFEFLADVNATMVRKVAQLAELLDEFNNTRVWGIVNNRTSEQGFRQTEADKAYELAERMVRRCRSILDAAGVGPSPPFVLD